jgi:hypothetical protein
VLDERILEYLCTHDVALPTEIGDHPDISASTDTVRERAELLAGVDLVSFHERGDLIEITTWGRSYIRGDINAELHEPRIDRSSA